MTDYKTLDRQYIFNTYARYPITLVRGEGIWVWDDKDKKYLDLLTGIACTPLGHAHPAVTAAITKQAATLMHTSNLYYSIPCIELAKWLVEHGGLDKVFFCNSGAEANEGAIKLARKHQVMKGHKNKFTILSAEHSFHGRTFGALTATAKPKIQEKFHPLVPGFRYQDWSDTAAFCNAIDESIAAVILEPVQGEGGINVAPVGFLEAVRNKCDQIGALLIFDEVQCGVGRTGELFAYQYFGVKPDIITLAKGIANGLPLGAMCARDEIATSFVPGDHGSTFGGNLVACSASLATLKVVNEQLPNIKKISAYLWMKLQQLQQKYPTLIEEIRGKGLMIGVELKCDAKKVLRECQHAGLLLNVTDDTVLRLLPPYIMTTADIDHAITILENVLIGISK